MKHLLLIITAVFLLSGCSKKDECQYGTLTVVGGGLSSTSFFWKNENGGVTIHTVNRNEKKTIVMLRGSYIIQFQNINWQIPVIREIVIEGCKDKMLQL